MSRDVIFIRNADIDTETSNLSSTGMEQAIMTAKYIKDKLEQDPYDNVKILVSPEACAMETVIPLVNNLKENGIKFNFRILQYLYEYRRPNKEDYISEINGKRYPIKVDKIWDSFTKRVEIGKICIEKEFNDTRDEKQLLIVYGHPVFFSALFSNFVNQGKFYPKNYKEITFQFANCSMSCAGFEKESKKWKIYFIAATNHLEGMKTGNHVNF